MKGVAIHLAGRRRPSTASNTAMKIAYSLTLSVALFLTACSSTDHRGRSGAASGEDGDYVTGSPLGTPLPERQEGASFLSSNVDRAKFSPVYFGFDSTSLGSSEKAKLHAIAEAARSDGSTLILAGFTDERGTPEYNRGLGERRAQTVREALVHAGAKADSIQTVSFGAEMPADSGSGESAWAKNRRAEFGVVR